MNLTEKSLKSPIGVAVGVGLIIVLGIVSVLLRVIVFLFSGKSQEEVNLQIGHVVTDV